MSEPLFGALYVPDAGADAGMIMAVAREFSPRVAPHPRGDVVMDLGGLSRLLGDRHAIAAELRRTAAERRLHARIAVADTRTAVRLLVHQRPGLAVIGPEGHADALAPLPVDALLALVADAPADKELTELIRTLRRWGVATLGALVALPAGEVAARLGQRGVRWQRAAAGEDLQPLVPAVPEERFEQALDLEWPIEGLEPLSFVLGRLLEPMSAHLERRDRGAAVIHVRLHLVNREQHERSLQLPVPMRDARTLRTLLLLDLESHPPAAAIDRVVVAVDPTPGRVVQFSLLAKPLPSPEQLSTLMARLQALMGDTRCGAPAMVDSWQPGACAMRPFMPRDSGTEQAAGIRPQASGIRPQDSGVSGPLTDPVFRVPSPLLRQGSGGQAEAPVPVLALRRFRTPVIARVAVDEGRPVQVTTERRGVGGGRVETCAGPWRTSGGWWTDRTSPASAPVGQSDVINGRAESRAPAAPWRRVDGSGSWDRDEWDVTLADRVTYRVFRERDSGKWFIDGVVD